MLHRDIYSKQIDGKQKLLKDADYERISKYMYDKSGINLDQSKKVLIESRLLKRLRINSYPDFESYLNATFAGKIPNEENVLLNLLTTNETYFFREPHHFENLVQIIENSLAGKRNAINSKFRVWSAACSSGEETYSLAMLLEDKCGPGNWELTGSDISTDVLAKAKMGHYAMDRIEGIPQEYLKRFCLKGFGPQEGTMLVDSALRSKVSFLQINLKEELPNLGEFDVIFLRNVIIYFDRETKKEIINRVLQKLRPGGFLFIGHSETLKGISENVKQAFHTVYQKV